MKTLKKVAIKYEEVKTVPELLSPNIVYIVNYQEEIEGCLFLCFCGCGNKVWIPIGPGEWSYTLSEKGFSLKPSVQERRKCRSHYIITNNIANFV